MIERDKIREGVINMFRVNMGVKRGERVLVLTDVPSIEDWVTRDIDKLVDMVERSLLAKMVWEIGKEAFPECSFEFYTYPATWRSGTEPGKDVEDKMKSADVVIALTSYSITHTKAREEATKAGVRIASMPTFLGEMFYPGGPMAADYRKIAEETKKLAKLLTEAENATVKSPAGTDISFSLKGRSGLVDAGIFTEPGSWGNLPSGEAYIAPVEGTANGRLVAQKGWFPRLKEDMTFVFKDGLVVEVIGGGEVGEEFRDLLKVEEDREPYLSRRNLAELGIGTNPNAKRPDNVLEAEKIRGTVHMAIGDNSHMGGKVSSDIHQDFVIPKPTLILDGKTVMKDGEILI